MCSYVIDENVVLNATHGKKSDNTPAHAETIFIYKIFKGHGQLFMNEKIKAKFYNMPKKIASRYKAEFLDNHVVPRLLEMIHNSERITIVDGIQNNFKGVKECDTEFVGVALQSGGVLVTADYKLKKEIAKDQNVSKCKCMTVEEIMP